MTSATGYSFTRISDTAISGNALYSALSGEDVRSLQFASATSGSKKAVTLAASGATGSSALSLGVAQWYNAAVDTQLLDTSIAEARLALGPDAQSQASYYVSLFNIHSGDTRILRFTQTTASAGSTTIGTSDGTSTYISCSDNTTPGADAPLFNAGTEVGSNFCGAFAGLSRIVLVTNPFPDSGDRVRFTVLPGSL